MAVKYANGTHSKPITTTYSVFCPRCGKPRQSDDHREGKCQQCEKEVRSFGAEGLKTLAVTLIQDAESIEQVIRALVAAGFTVASVLPADDKTVQKARQQFRQRRYDPPE